MTEGRKDINFDKLEYLVTIPLEEYTTLHNDSKILQVLLNAGVDSWEGYEPTMKEVRKLL